MGANGHSNPFDSSKAEVGEIDTRAPFASVKAAVNLFGEVAFSGDRSSGKKSKPSTPSKSSTPEQKAFATETQLHLAQKELNKFKEQLQNAETTRARALAELDNAKKTLHDLTTKLTVTNESRELALKAAEAAKDQTNQLKGKLSSSGGDQTEKIEIEKSREQYAPMTMELDAAKQELRRIRKEFKASVEAKISAFSQESEAKQQFQENALKADQLLQEITVVQESLMHVKLATDQAREEESKMRAEKDSTRESYRLALEETQKKLATLNDEFNTELHKELELQQAETCTEINAIRKKLEDSQASDIESANSVTTELDRAREALMKVVEEESSLRSLVESLKVELATVTKQHNELKEKDIETEALVSDLHIKLQKCKVEFEAAVAAESKSSSASLELVSTLQQLQAELESSQQEAEVLKKEAEAIRTEAESAKSALTETERNLKATLKEGEAAKEAEARALHEIKNLSEKTSAVRSSTSGEITISKEEYESLRQKAAESEKLTEMKVGAAGAQVEAVKASEAEAKQRLEAVRKEMEELEAAKAEALKRAEMAEAAKKAVQGELRRWREMEQKRAIEIANEMASRLQAETEVRHVKTEASPQPPRPTPNDGKMLWATKKASMLHNLSGMFHRKKSTVYEKERQA